MLMLCCRKMHQCVAERAAVSQWCVLRAEAQEASRALMLRSRWEAQKVVSAKPHMRQCQVRLPPSPLFLHGFWTSPL